MVTRQNYSEDALTYMQVRLSRMGDLGRLLAQGVDRTDEAFAFVPDIDGTSGPAVCFARDVLEVGSDDVPVMRRLEAEFVHQFLVSDPRAALLILSTMDRVCAHAASAVKSDVFRFCIFPLPGFSDGQCMIASDPAITVEDVHDFLSYLPMRPFYCGLCFAPDSVWSDPAPVPNRSELDRIIASWRHILVSVFDHYALLICSRKDAGREFPPSGEQDRQLLDSTARVALSASTGHYFTQILCSTVSRPWVRQCVDTADAEYWAFVPPSANPLITQCMGSKLRDLYPAIDEAEAAAARGMMFRFIAAYLARDPRNYLLFDPYYEWRPTSNPLEPGCFAGKERGTAALIVDTDRTSVQNKELWSLSYKFQIVNSEAAPGRIEASWKNRPGDPICLALINGSRCGLDWLRQAERLQLSDIENSIVPATDHVIVGAYQGDIGLIRSN
jgi:hypothetical protein